MGSAAGAGHGHAGAGWAAGFGAVYRARLLSAGGFSKQVALKVLKAGDDQPYEVVQRLRDEARILGLIRYRAVVGVDGLAHLDQGWVVVMEYVPGVDLSQPIRHGPLPPRVAVEIVEEVASALQVAWETPSQETGEPLYLVHRDLKPANLRITAQGEVKILDFGLARADFSEREARTRSYLFGSFKYMPIERLEGVEGPKADIYALGLVLAEMLVGRRIEDPPRMQDHYDAYVRALVQEAGRVVQRAMAGVGPETCNLLALLLHDMLV